MKPTRYEVCAERDGVRLLVGYTARRSRPGMLELCRRDGTAAALLAMSEPPGGYMAVWAWAMPWKPRESASIGDGWVVRFTGRTEKEAAADRQPLQSVVEFAGLKESKK